MCPYLTLMTPAAPQRQYALREVFNVLRWLVRTGAAWRYLPHDFPPWLTVYQQTQRWIAAGCFEAIVAELRVLIPLAKGRCRAIPSAGHAPATTDTSRWPIWRSTRWASF